MVYIYIHIHVLYWYRVQVQQPIIYMTREQGHATNRLATPNELIVGMRGHVTCFYIFCIVFMSYDPDYDATLSFSFTRAHLNLICLYYCRAVNLLKFDNIYANLSNKIQIKIQVHIHYRNGFPIKVGLYQIFCC